MSPAPYPSHSAHVERWLDVQGTRHDVVQTSATWVKLRSVVGLRPGRAQLSISIDGRVTVSDLALPLGASLDNAWVVIEDVVSVESQAD